MIEPNGGPPSRLNLPHDVLFQRQNEPRRKTVLLEVKNDQVPETQQTDKTPRMAGLSISKTTPLERVVF